MTITEIEEIRNLYKNYLEVQKMINELKDKTLEYKTNKELLKLIPYKDIEKIKTKDAKEVLRKIYIKRAKKSKELFNIKVYMGSYYYDPYPDGEEDLYYTNDILTFENDPKAIYRVFCDIESVRDSREERGEFIYKEQLEEYEEKNTIIVVPNEDIKKSIIEASKYSDWDRSHGIDRYFGLCGNMDESIKFNIKGDIDAYGDLVPLQNYFFDLLMKMQPEEAVAQLTRKYKPYRNFYDYDSIKK